MTSGNFHSVAIASINPNRGDRQRRDLPDIASLADSINRLGLIHPIVITRDLNLVAGERRLEAVRSLGWTHINVQYSDETDKGILYAVELEENIKRKDISWQDECRAIHAYHNLRLTEVADWTMEDTAAAVGVKIGTISEKISVAKNLESGNTRVTEAPRFSIAKGIVARANERAKSTALTDLKSIVSPKASAPERTILNADFTEWAPAYSGPKFNFIHCDFPYGIDADKFNQGAAPLHGGYDDSEDTYWSLCSTLARELDRIAAESCHFMFWFSMRFYTPTLDFFNRNTDIRFDAFPLLWTKSDNIGILPDPTRGPRRIYETCLFGSRGDRKIVRAKSNSVSLPSDRSTHMSIKPQPVLQYFFEMFVDGSTNFLDPTCGSGSSVRAAISGGASRAIGIEINSEFADEANQKANAEKEKFNAGK